MSLGTLCTFSSTTHFIERSSFTAWKQLIRFTPAMACAASMQRGNLPWPPTPAWRTADHSLTIVAFVSSCCHANTTEPPSCCQLSPQTAEALWRCLVSVTYWATVTLEPLMLNIVGSRFTSMHLNECCITWSPCIQRLPEGIWLLRGLLRIDLISLKRTRY